MCTSGDGSETSTQLQKQARLLSEKLIRLHDELDELQAAIASAETQKQAVMLELEQRLQREKR